jgi:hypothetical protein
MSRENVALLHQSIDAVNRRDLDAFLDLMDSDVEVVSRIVAIEGGLHGHDGVRRWWDAWFEAFPDYDIEVIEVRDHGELTLAALRALGHGGGSEVPFEDKAWLACRWRSGKCFWWRVFSNRDDAFEALGLSE